MRIISLILFSATAFIACGSDDSSSSEFHCCLNGSYYQCPDQTSFNKCAQDPSGCTRDSSKDSTCATP